MLAASTVELLSTVSIYRYYSNMNVPEKIVSMATWHIIRAKKLGLQYRPGGCSLQSHL